MPCLRRAETADETWRVQDWLVVLEQQSGRPVSSACEQNQQRPACSAPPAARCSSLAAVHSVAHSSPPLHPRSPAAFLAAADSARSAAAQRTARPAAALVSVSPPPVSSAAVVSSAPLVSLLVPLASVARPSAAAPTAVAVSHAVLEHGTCARSPLLPVASAPGVEPAAAPPSMAADECARGTCEERTTQHPYRSPSRHPPHPQGSRPGIEDEMAGSSMSGVCGERVEIAVVGGRCDEEGGRLRRAHRSAAAMQAGSTSRW